MDLRVKKTQKAIKEAFYQLKKKKKLNKISVKELSELAMINKATFYLHYNDVYDLSEKLKAELVDAIVGRVRFYDLRKGKDEIKLFVDELSRCVIERTREIRVLFDGADSNDFVNLLEDRLKRYIFMNYPNIPNNNEVNLTLTFLIQGVYHSHIRNTLINPEMRIQSLTAAVLRTVDF